MAKKYNGGLKFGSAAESSGLQRDPFPTHSGVQPGPLHSGSPAKFDWEATKDIIKKTDWLGTEPKKEDVRPPVGTKGTEKPTESKSSNKPHVKPGGKATGKIGDYAQGSQERTAEYDARGWAHDKTTTGHKDYRKPETIQKTEPTTTEKTADPKPEIKGSFRDNYQEGSEKTKNLERKLRKKDQQTEDAYVESELADAHAGKYGKGLFGGFLRRQGAKGKHKRKSRQEDRVREKYNKSKAYDAMTPEQRASADAAKKLKGKQTRGELSQGLQNLGASIGAAYGKGGSGNIASNMMQIEGQQKAQKTNEENLKIKTKQADLTASRSEEDRQLKNERTRLLNKQTQINIDASNKAKDGGAKVPAAESTFAVNDDGSTNYEGTYASEVTGKYST